MSNACHVEIPNVRRKSFMLQILLQMRELQLKCDPTDGILRA
jgi:hypothetical protein